MDINNFINQIVVDSEISKLNLKDFILKYKELNNRETIKKMFSSFEVKTDAEKEDMLVNLYFERIIGWEKVKFKNILNEEQKNKGLELNIFTNEDLEKEADFNLNSFELFIKNNDLLLDFINLITNHINKKKD